MRLNLLWSWGNLRLKQMKSLLSIVTSEVPYLPRLFFLLCNCTKLYKWTSMENVLAKLYKIARKQNPILCPTYSCNDFNFCRISLIYMFQTTSLTKQKYIINFLMNGVGFIFKTRSISLSPTSPPSTSNWASIVFHHSSFLFLFHFLVQHLIKLVVVSGITQCVIVMLKQSCHSFFFGNDSCHSWVITWQCENIWQTFSSSLSLIKH